MGFQRNSIVVVPYGFLFGTGSRRTVDTVLARDLTRSQYLSIDGEYFRITAVERSSDGIVVTVDGQSASPDCTLLFAPLDRCVIKVLH